MSLISKVTSELEIQVGVKDRTLAEFIIGTSIISRFSKRFIKRERFLIEIRRKRCRIYIILCL